MGRAKTAYENVFSKSQGIGVYPGTLLNTPKTHLKLHIK